MRRGVEATAQCATLSRFRASARIFALHRKFSSQPRHCLPRCAGCLASARIIALHCKFSSQPRHLVPRCAGCLASACIFLALFTASFPHNHGTLCRAVLDVLQVIASSHCTASCRQNPAPCAALCCMACKCSHLRVALQVFVTITLCRAVLDVFQLFASSRSTGGFHHSNTLCRAVLDVSQMLASSRSTGPFCHRKASRPKCVRTTPSRICQNHSVHSQTKMLRLCLNIS